MSSKDSTLASGSRRGQQWAAEDRKALFQLCAAVFYQHKISLDEVACDLDLSMSVIKRMLGRLRRLGVVQGRLGSLRLNFDLLTKPPFSFCSAVILVESDIKRLRELSCSEDAGEYHSEEELLRFLSHSLARTDRYKGRLIIEHGYIVVGSAQINLVMTAYALSTNALFDFTRLAVEQKDGVERAQTLIVAFTA